MKKLYLILFACFAIVSCRKEIYAPAVTATKPLLAVNAENYLRTEMNAADFSALNFDRIVINNYDSITSTVKIYFKESSAFAIVRFNNAVPVQGKIIEVVTDNLTNGFNGTITIASLDRKDNVVSAVQHGVLKKTSSSPAVTNDIIPVYEEMEDVLIVAQYPPSGDISFTLWMDLLHMMGGGYDNYNYYEYYDMYNGGGGSGGGGNGSGGGGNNGGNSGGGNVEYDEPLQVDFEGQYNEDAIDLNRFIHCFDLIPDAGSHCTIEILTDLPVNNDPNKFFDWTHGTPGHTFLQINKSNGSQIVSQNIGFYPKTGWKLTLTPAAMQGKFVNNEGHEFNASYKVDISPQQLQLAISKMYSLQSMNYDIINNNCTDWALNVFNGTVTTNEQLTIPMYDLPGGNSPAGSQTPQGLYQRLVQLKEQGGARANDITVPLVGWVGNSNGPCN